MSEHTPGPWRLGRPGAVVADNPKHIMQGGSDVEYYGGYCVCESVTLSNACLIASAPEMASTLKEVRERLRMMLDQDANVGKGDVRQMLKRIDHTLSKAEAENE